MYSKPTFSQSISTEKSQLVLGSTENSSMSTLAVFTFPFLQAQCSGSELP